MDKKIVIVEDIEVIRTGLSMMISATDGLNCIGEYESVEEYEKDIKSIEPDLVIMDIGLPGKSGIDGVRETLKLRPNAIIVMLTIFEDSDNIFNAICAGATGYLLKKTPPAQIIESIKDALNGGSPMSSPIARKVVNFFKKFVPPDSPKQENLTDREKEILNGLSKGLSYKTIGESLFISVDTVRYHITKIYKKLHVHSQSEAVAKAIKKGFLTILTTISYAVNI